MKTFVSMAALASLASAAPFTFPTAGYPAPTGAPFPPPPATGLPVPTGFPAGPWGNGSHPHHPPHHPSGHPYPPPYATGTAPVQPPSGTAPAKRNAQFGGLSSFSLPAFPQPTGSAGSGISFPGFGGASGIPAPTGGFGVGSASSPSFPSPISGLTGPSSGDGSSGALSGPAMGVAKHYPQHGSFSFPAGGFGSPTGAATSFSLPGNGPSGIAAPTGPPIPTASAPGVAAPTGGLPVPSGTTSSPDSTEDERGYAGKISAGSASENNDDSGSETTDAEDA